MIYLDNSTTTAPSKRAVEKMLPFLTERWGVVSAPHPHGQRLVPALESAYNKLYKAVGAGSADTVLFTSSGAEAINQVVLSVYEKVTKESGKNHFLTATTDEAPSIMAVGRLEQLGCVGKMIDASTEGCVTAKTVAESITPRTALISLSWANGLTGVVQPIADVAKLCKQRGILLHLDATHAFGNIFYDLVELGIDYLTLNGDQLGAPKGTGILYARQGVPVAPLIVGGAEQSGLRAGAVDIAGLTAIAEALEEQVELRDTASMEVARLRDRLEKGIQSETEKAEVLFQNSERIPGVTVVSFPGVVNDALLFSIGQQGVFASFGGGSFQRISLVLEACGVAPAVANNAVSFSLSNNTTETEIDQAVKIIGRSVTALQRASALLKENT